MGPDRMEVLCTKKQDLAAPKQSRKRLVPVESKIRTYHGRVWSERPAERPGGGGSGIRPGNESPPPLQGTEKMSPQRFSRSTNRRNPMQTDGGTKSAVDNRFISGISPGR